MPCTLKGQEKCSSSEKLLPIASKLAEILYEVPSIVGVALTGSVARFERHAHDIDLVVLHNGRGKGGDAIAAHPPSDIELYGHRAEDLKRILPWTHARRISTALDLIGDTSIPLNIISVDRKVLQDCAYLWNLQEVAKEEDFFNRIFCDIPLLLLIPGTAKSHSLVPGELRAKHRVAGEMLIRYVDIGHRCSNKRCLPRKPWKIRKKERDRARLIANGMCPA